MLSPHEEFAAFRDHIAALPTHCPLAPTDLRVSVFQKHRDGPLEIYYVPFHHLTPQARVVLVGITPGWTQMERAYQVARDAVQAGLPAEAVWDRVSAAASFAGPMRANLIRMLDGLGLATMLGVPSAAVLFAERRDLLHTTSAIRDAVFIKGKNYTGHTPPLLRTPVLRQYLTETLAPELARNPHALVIPLGQVAANALDYLSAKSLVDGRRCLQGFPHPSGANGHRHRLYLANQEQLRQHLATWFATSGPGHPADHPSTMPR